MSTSWEDGQKAREEWMAWRLLCTLLQARGIDPNDDAQEELIAVIRHWGEEYRRLYEGTGERQVHAAHDAALALRLMAERKSG